MTVISGDRVFSHACVGACDLSTSAVFYDAALAPLGGIPTVVVTGDQDRLIPKEHSDRIVERLPDSEFVVVPDAGHMVLLEKHDEVTAALRALLRRAAAQVGVPVH